MKGKQLSRINNAFGFTGNLGTGPDYKFNPNNGDPIANFPLFADSSYTNRETAERIEQGD